MFYLSKLYRSHTRNSQYIIQLNEFMIEWNKKKWNEERVRQIWKLFQSLGVGGDAYTHM